MLTEGNTYLVGGQKKKERKKERKKVKKRQTKQPRVDRAKISCGTAVMDRSLDVSRFLHQKHWRQQQEQKDPK